MRYEPEQLKADREAREQAQRVSDGYKLRVHNLEVENTKLKATLAKVKGKLNCRQDYEADTDGAYGPGFCIGKADMDTVDALLADISEPPKGA